MQRRFIGLMACVAMLVLVHGASAQVKIQIQAQPAPAIADLVAPNMGAGRLAHADAVLVGRVVAFEPMDVEVPPTAGQPKATYRIAVVQVTESIFGLKKDAQTIRVGMLAQINNAPGNGIQILPAVQPGGLGRRPFPGYGALNLQIGQDGLFTLTKHHKENFYTAPNFTHFSARENNPNFDSDVRTAKQVAKVRPDPVAALKAEDRQDRYTAAALLISKYRGSTAGQPVKSEPIDAEESKLILKALSEGDWTIGRFNAPIPNPFELFNQLGITAKDGYTQGRTQQEISQAMQKWLDQNHGNYRINRLVPDPNGKAPGIQPVVEPGIRPLPIRLEPAK